jgi:methyltransferase (TIGR00027 family)
MARQTVGRTALGTAICRLIEQYQPAATRLFDDPVVEELVGGAIRLMMRFAAMRNLTIRQTDGIAPGIFGAQICRTRYIDDAVQAGLSQGIGQLVILGAGFDTRPYRLPGMEHVQVFEVDLQAVQDEKKKRLQSYGGWPPANVAFIPIDFDTQTLEAVLAGTAFDPSRPALFIWEGVTRYISEAAVRQTLGFIGKLAPGSILVFTYVLSSVIERRSAIPGAERMMDTVAQHAAWIFGLEPSSVPDFLRPFHLALIADVGNVDYQEKYLQPLGRNLVVFEGERIAHAVVE